MENNTTLKTAVSPIDVTHQPQTEPVPVQSGNPDSVSSLLKRLNAVTRMKNPTLLLDLRKETKQAIPECENKRDELEQVVAKTSDNLEKLAYKQQVGKITNVISKLQGGLKAIADRAKELTSVKSAKH